MSPHAAIYSSRLLLSAVFAVAALTKASNRAASIQAMRDFGVPGGLAPFAAAILPPIELIVAALLISGAFAPSGAVAAAALLLIFMAAMTASLARGKAPACNCFGQLQSKPIGWSTVLRNAILLAVAILVIVFEPRDGGVNAFSGLARVLGVSVVSFTLVLMAVGIIAGQTYLLFHLFRQHGRLLLRVDEVEKRLRSDAPPQGLPIGTPAPAFNLTDSAEPLPALQWLRDRGTGALLVFTDPGCQPCAELLPQLPVWQREHPERPIILVTKSAGHLPAQRHGVQNIAIQQDTEIAEAYGVAGTPAAVIITAERVIGSSVALGKDAIARLLGSAPAPPAPLVEARAS